MLNFPGLLDPRTDAQVMRVESPVASYWRANALDSFSGVAWLSSGSFGERLTAEGPPVPTRSTFRKAIPRPRRDRHGDLRGPVPVHRLPLHGRLAQGTGLRPARARVHQQRAGASAAAATWADVHLRTDALVPQVKPADLVGRGRDYPPDILPDTTLPFPAATSVTGTTAQGRWRAAMDDTPADREWRDLYQLNRQIVRTATDPYQITLRIEQYLRSTTPTRSPARDSLPVAVRGLLFDTKTGYCQHFAGAMAALVRFNGSPLGWRSGSRPAPW